MSLASQWWWQSWVEGKGNHIPKWGRDENTRAWGRDGNARARGWDGNVRAREQGGNTRARGWGGNARARWEGNGNRALHRKMKGEGKGKGKGDNVLHEKGTCMKKKIISASRSTTINKHTLNSLHKRGPLWSKTLSWELSGRYLFVGGKREEGCTKVRVRCRWLKRKDGK